ncbi:arylamine N-acetyltransferase family protein [Marinomonas pollencensis]|uniref:N-hydroxyarylamine O-acetyltransferase n=1 Tax=Marinomonas pollencensis TaxID=491954 RepID=A0A3E0DLJ2_9GAMM|nr:arylamine N-acetyltransferase [Marinomonas pollencensis]REG83668.1 N-hydroxyarylamine O-acetyltransferase [Marinomonas pollencensis]
MRRLTPPLQAYLLDLGLTPPDFPCLAFVDELQARHVAQHSFNSLSVALEDDLPLDIDALSNKFVKRGLGGYCFEHNKLMFELLKALGYDVQLVLARVLNNRDISAPRTHRVSVLRLEGKRYLLDSGFGANGPIAPLQLTPNVRQVAGQDSYQIVAYQTAHGDEYALQIEQQQTLFTLYRFDLACYSDADCELAHFYSHKHANAVFVNNLMVSIKSAQSTVSLQNDEMRVTTQGVTRVYRITSAELLQRHLLERFSITLEEAAVARLFERFIAPKLAVENRLEL